MIVNIIRENVSLFLAIVKKSCYHLVHSGDKDDIIIKQKLQEKHYLLYKNLC